MEQHGRMNSSIQTGAESRKPYFTLILCLALVALPFVCIRFYGHPWVHDLLESFMPWILILPLVGGIVLGHIVVARSLGGSHAFPFCLIARVAMTIAYGVLIVGTVLASFGPYVSTRSLLSSNINNAKHVLLYLKSYAADHDSKYPDALLPNAQTSNDAFRQMFKEGIVDDEKVFGGFLSPFRPDGKIGRAPDFAEAVKAGENHWAMTKGITEADPDKTPLIFENPSEATWPPKWNADLTGKMQPGRVWKGGRIIVGFKDGSVEVLHLESESGKSVGLKARADGTPIFPTLPGRKLEVLNVAK
jgi:hypothetical protein